MLWGALPVKPQWRMRTEVEFWVRAWDKADAEEELLRVLDYTDLESVRKPSATKVWEEDAKQMLEDGMSQGEVARTLGVERATVSRKFPGTGWTNGEGGHIAHLQRKVNEYERRLGIR